MSDDEPHRVVDNAPSGSVSEGVTTIRRMIKRKKTQKIIVSIGFDENQKEFELWDYLYDVKTDYFEMDAIPDYENRIQYYEIKADRKAMHKLRLWLMRNEIKYKLSRT